MSDLVIYDGIDKDTQGKLELIANYCEQEVRKSIAAQLEWAKWVHEANKLLANHADGVFGRWVEAKLHVSRRTAENAINVHELVATLPRGSCETVSQLDWTSLIELARDSTPQNVIDAVFKEAKKGKRWTAKETKEFIKAETVAEEEPEETSAGTAAPESADACSAADSPESPGKSLGGQTAEDYACKVCGAVPDATGVIEHGRGCYTQSEDGGGISYVEEADNSEDGLPDDPPSTGSEGQEAPSSGKVCPMCNRGGWKPTKTQAEKVKTTAGAAFECWWLSYPRRVGKPAGEKAWKKAITQIVRDLGGSELEAQNRLIDLTEDYAAAVHGADLQFVPHPSTWLNEQRYADDPETWAIGKNGQAQPADFLDPSGYVE